MLRIGQQAGVQQIWDICHFGFSDDLSPLHPHFTRRFVAVCEAFVRFYRSVQPDGLLWVTPINEVSFISWLGGEDKGTTPYCTGVGWDVKYQLMAAYIEGIKAMRVLGSLSLQPKRPTPKNTGPTGFGLSEASAQRQSGPACR